MVTGRMGHISVFCSYAREDEDYRKKLESCLEPLRAEKVIDDWYDSRIKTGSHWDEQIRNALEKSRLVLFLVTPDLLASEYVRNVELPRSLELERAGRCQIVPIVVRATEWGTSPLAGFQAVPGQARPIDSFPDPETAFAEVRRELTDVCKRIVDWENPYKRAQVGDWTHIEQTGTTPDGMSVTAQGTSEVVEKTKTKAVVLIQMVLGHERQEHTITIDLTEPLEDRMGDMMSQIGQRLPPNAEVWIGPSQYEDDVLFIGGKRYETVKATRQMRIAQRGEKVEGTIQNWRCIDVPLDGIVKGTGDMQIMRQDLVLLDYGHGDAAARKPLLFPPGTATSSGQGAGPSGSPTMAAPPQAIFSPGRWQIEMRAFAAVTELDVFLQPNGVLNGTQVAMGVTSEVQGQWGFDLNTNVLALNLVAVMMGMPVGQEMVQMQIMTGPEGVLQGTDAMGRQFLLRRIG